MDAFAEIQISELGLKSKSKKEVYDLLCNEGSIYLPPIEDAHHKFISQILVGDKKYLKCSHVKVCRVPHLKGSIVEGLLLLGQQRVNLNNYLSDYEYHKPPNRQWLCNVLNPLLGRIFAKSVQERMEARVKHVAMKKKLTVKLLPEFVNMFMSSKNISVQKGRSHFLIKKYGKRKWEEVQDDGREKLKKTNDTVLILNKEMELQIEGFKEMEEKYLTNSAKL